LWVGDGWTDFQKACDDLPDRALLLAPCGSGKTLAAWRWIAARLDVRPAARVIFLYPTRGTATEGFRDYVSWAPEADAALVHGTSTYDLEGLLDDLDAADPRSGRTYQNHARLFALQQWPKRIFSATVDQFLAFMQYAYAPMCHLPLLADAVVVVDEVHSFDRLMFKALLDFLNHFEAPVLCMTATLPSGKRAKLEECGLTVYPQSMPEDLQRSADYARYDVRVTTQHEARQAVLEALGQGQRVLWVLNTVERAQTLAQELANNPFAERLAVQTAEGEAVPLFCYHSRFKLEDRNRQHRTVVDGFKRRTDSPSSAVLAVTTQVCEMSLDLDADLLVTEEAPVTALVQRMGRCCRESLPMKGRVGRVFVYPPDDEKPYTKEQLTGVRAFAERLAARLRVSQSELQQALEDAPQPAEVPSPECRFVDSGPWAMGREESFRDIDAWTRPSVVPDDVSTYESLRRASRDGWRADGLVLPVPVFLAKGRDPRLPSWLAVAEGGHYSPSLGYVRGARRQPVIV
jgi:CRISPR-associated endonuclease/helicase Cas3